MRKWIVGAGALGVAIAAWSVRAEPEPATITPAILPAAQKRAPRPRLAEGTRTAQAGKTAGADDLATITYDTGSFSTLPTVPAAGTTFSGPNFVFGNRFALGDALLETASFSVTGVSAYLARVDDSANGSGSIYVTLFEAPAGGSAPLIGWLDFSGAQAGTFNQFPITGATGLSGQEILAGIYNSLSATSFASQTCTGDCVGFDVGTVNGYGHHAFHATSYGASFSDIPGYNAMVRINLGGTLPVELMSFSVE